MCKELNYYSVLSYIHTLFKEYNPGNVYSVFAYGSVCRFEIVPEYSDIDIMVMLNDEHLYFEDAEVLNVINNELCKKYSVHTHLRIRNRTDIKKRTSGVIDCGITSTFNKLRDSITIFGKSPDADYFEYLQNVSENEIAENLFLRFSELRYQIRALIALGEYSKFIHSPIGLKSSETRITHEIGNILCTLSEMVCFFHGECFSSRKEALSNAYNIAKFELFNAALDLKFGRIEKMDSFSAIVSIDEFINYFVNNSKKNNLSELIKKINFYEKSVSDKKEILDLLIQKTNNNELAEKLSCIFREYGFPVKNMENYNITKYNILSEAVSNE